MIKNELEEENVDFTQELQTNTTDNSETKLQLFLPFSGKQGIQLHPRIPWNVINMHYIRRHKTFIAISCER